MLHHLPLRASAQHSSNNTRSMVPTWSLSALTKRCPMRLHHLPPRGWKRIFRMFADFLGPSIGREALDIPGLPFPRHQASPEGSYGQGQDVIASAPGRPLGLCLWLLITRLWSWGTHAARSRSCKRFSRSVYQVATTLMIVKQRTTGLPGLGKVNLFVDYAAKRPDSSPYTNY